MHLKVYCSINVQNWENIAIQEDTQEANVKCATLYN